MPEPTLEERVAALEKAVAELRAAAPAPKERWWETGEPMSPEMRETAAEMDAYGRYFRVTGRLPPDDWNPGDPIPDPWGDAGDAPR